MPAASVTHYRAKVGALSRSRTPDDPEFVDAKRNLRAANLEQHIERVLAEAPPLTPAQRDRIATLVKSGGAR